MLGGLGLVAAGLGIVVTVVIAATQLSNANMTLVWLGIAAGCALVLVGLGAAGYGLYKNGEPKRRSAKLAELVTRGQSLAKEADPLGDDVPPAGDLLRRMEEWDKDIRSLLDKWPHQLAKYEEGLFSLSERSVVGRNDTLGWISERQVRLDKLMGNTGIPGDGVGAWG